MFVASGQRLSGEQVLCGSNFACVALAQKPHLPIQLSFKMNGLRPSLRIQRGCSCARPDADPSSGSCTCAAPPAILRRICSSCFSQATEDIVAGHAFKQLGTLDYWAAEEEVVMTAPLAQRDVQRQLPQSCHVRQQNVILRTAWLLGRVCNTVWPSDAHFLH